MKGAFSETRARKKEKKTCHKNENKIKQK